MKIAVEGCAHGELDNIYDTIKCLEEKEGIKVDLLICCGDFQSSRNMEDLLCMAIPQKYHNICSFYKYYNGEKIAPILTIFIGGNHEASNYLQELPYGGWVAQNIYYLGYAGVINIAGIRIGGLSGIYKNHDYMKGHFETPPYDDSSKRSVYHIRNLEVFRLKQLSQPINIFLSHDWPSGVWNYGNKNKLIRFKPHFKDDIETGKLGSKPAEELLQFLKPDYWFSAHLHCKFAALIPHDCGKVTRFLSLDKCLPHRRFLQIVDIEHNSNLKLEISYDLEWLTILKLTNHLLSVKSVLNFLPGPGGPERWSFTPTEEEKEIMFLNFDKDLVVPNNFAKTAEGYKVENSQSKSRQPKALRNPQTALFCKKLMIDDPLQLLLKLEDITKTASDVTTDVTTENESFIDSHTDATLQIPVKNRTSLILPQPVNTSQCSFDDADEQKLQNNSKSPEENVPEKQESEVETIKEPGEAPIPKKFRRRNASLYQKDENSSIT